MPENDPAPAVAPSAPRRKQSPGYPALDLRVAVDRTIELYKASPKHPVPLSVAAELWGYSPKSSSTKVAAAALKRYGLVEDVGGGGQRQLALTAAGREVAFYSGDRDDPRWPELLHQAALAPKIYRQVLDHFGLPLPDRRVVLRHLLFDVGFQDEATAADFLTRLDATMRFAGVTSLEGGAGLPLATVGPEGDRVEEDGDAADGVTPEPPSRALHARPSQPISDRVWRAAETGPAEAHSALTPPPESVYDAFKADRTTVQIPYSNGRWAALSAAFPITSAEWTMMMGVLEAMKPGLVTEPPSDDDS